MKGTRNTKSAPVQTERPGWIDETPPEIIYDLEMFDNGETVQEIYMTRAEFISVKAHLAKLRGFTVEAEEEPAEESLTIHINPKAA